METSRAFDLRYKSLNDEQRQAVDAIDGPVMVIAGPGTGKTSILTLRIANILKKTDTAADSILALTFTESGVYSMRQKLAEIIGSAAYKVNIYTFHGFCNDIIKNYPEEFPRIISSQNVSDIDQIKILEEIIDNSHFEILKPYGDPHHYIRSIIGEINQLKQENISPNRLIDLLEKEKRAFSEIPDLYHEKGKYKGEMKGVYKDLQKTQAKNQELALVYVQYEEQLAKKKLYDYQDMILEVIKALESKRDLLLELQEKYQYVLADEHQDANSAQNKILELISNFHDQPNLFIVGDEKQAIFRFQGASLENFLYFQKLYPGAKKIQLKHNYRSVQSILDASHSLIIKNQQGKDLQTVLLAQAGYANKLINLYSFEKAQSELKFIAQDIKKKIQMGINPATIAILYRENKDAGPIGKALEKVGVPYVIESEQELYSDNEIAKLLLFMRAVNDLGKSEILGRALFIDFLKVDYVDVYRLIALANGQEISLFEALKEEKKLHDIYRCLDRFGKEAKNSGLLDCFEMLVRESGFLEQILGHKESIDKLAKLDRLSSQIKELVSSHKNYRLADFINYLDVLDKHNIVVKAKGRSLSQNEVHLLTAHRSKGLEFDFVYIVNLTDGHWGNKREMRKFKLPIFRSSDSLPDPIEDERRLLYVALTRAKKEIVLTYAKMSEEGKSLLPTQFLGEIDEELVEVIPTQELEKSFEAEHQTDFAEPKILARDIKDHDYLRKLFFEQGLSVTALNNYLACPWRYFFNNLIRLPEALSKHQIYGTAIHKSLRHFFDRYRDEAEVGESDLINLFEKYLAKEPLNQSDCEETVNRGRRALSGFYRIYKDTWPRTLINEFNVAGVYAELQEEVDGQSKILLKGQLDKLEILNDGQVNVVDYKTRQPLSRNHLLGETKNSDGNYYRQLVFYKILLDKYEEGKYMMRIGEIDFIEPDEKGRYKKEKFEITEADTKKLLFKIGEIATEIGQMAFWDKVCEARDCEYCKLRRLLG